MTVKEYLGQAYRIDQRINSKLEQVGSLRALARRPLPPSPILRPAAAGMCSPMESIIVKNH